MEARAQFAKRATERMHDYLLQEQPTYYFPLDRKVKQQQLLGEKDSSYDFTEIQEHVKNLVEEGVRDDLGEDEEEHGTVPDSIFDVSETHARLLRRVPVPEVWAGFKMEELAKYYSFGNDWKVEGGTLRAMLVAAYPSLKPCIERTTGNGSREIGRAHV